jgi:organic hydroperoxide reductase OsmC/OhrA
MANKHSATISWRRGGQPFTDNKYSRAHTWVFDGGATVAASASPHNVPEPHSVAANVDPEEAFVAAISSCHMLWFLAIAAKRGFMVDRYRDTAEGTMAKNDRGKQAFTKVTLRPSIDWGSAKKPTDDDVAAMHEEAHGECFIANSITAEVTVAG